MDLKRKGTGSVPKPKRSREVLPISEKVKILDMIEIEGRSYAEIARLYDKNESSIREVMKHKDKIRASFSVAPQNAKVTSTVRDQVLVHVEKILNLWVEDMNSKKMPVDGCVLRQKALSLYKEFRQNDETEVETKSFTASRGWLYRFRNRFNLKNIYNTGEAGTPDKQSYSAAELNQTNQFDAIKEESVCSTEEEHSLNVMNEGFEYISTEEEDEQEEPEVELRTWTVENFEEVFQLAERLKEKVVDYDPLIDRSVQVTLLLTEAMEPYQHIFDELKREREQLPVPLKNIDNEDLRNKKHQESKICSNNEHSPAKCPNIQENYPSNSTCDEMTRVARLSSRRESEIRKFVTSILSQAENLPKSVRNPLFEQICNLIERRMGTDRLRPDAKDGTSQKVVIKDQIDIEENDIVVKEEIFD